MKRKLLRHPCVQYGTESCARVHTSICRDTCHCHAHCTIAFLADFHRESPPSLHDSHRLVPQLWSGAVEKKLRRLCVQDETGTSQCGSTGSISFGGSIQELAASCSVCSQCYVITQHIMGVKRNIEVGVSYSEFSGDLEEVEPALRMSMWHVWLQATFRVFGWGKGPGGCT